MQPAASLSSSAPLVVHVTFGLDVGGLERLLLEIARRTDPEQMGLLFVSLGTTGPIGFELRALGWPVVALHRPSGFRPSLLFALTRLFHGVRAAVVHTHDARALVYGALAARAARVGRVVHTQHGQNLGLTERQLKLLGFAAKRTDAFVCVSHEARRRVVQQGIVPPKLHVIHNGIDIERIQKEVKESVDYNGWDRDSIVTIARLSPEKDVATLLRAFAQMRRTTPEAFLEVAGDGPCRGELLRETQRLGIESKVRFLGQVSKPGEVLARARLFVLPSVSEGVSLTLLEAMAAGIPVVATEVGGNPEVVEHGMTGRLVPPSDAHALAHSMATLWSDVAERARLAQAAQEWVTRRFHVQRMMDQYRYLYAARRVVRQSADIIQDVDANEPAVL